MREQVSMWHEPEHRLWNHFVEWSGRNCSPGNGRGHLVEWYWDIFKAGGYAEANWTQINDPLIPQERSA